MPVLGKWATGSPLIFWAGWELENCKIRAAAVQHWNFRIRRRRPGADQVPGEWVKVFPPAL
jgi:hypothetical protein